MSNSPGSFKYNVGVGHVGSYQVAGHPFMTGSASIESGVQHKISFPRIAKSITVINRTSVDLRVHFTDDDKAGNHTVAARHYITLGDNKDSMTFNVKCKEIYITSQGAGGAYEISAELTGIETREMYALTGSGLTETDTAND